MKKIVAFSFALVLSSSLSAETLRIFKCSEDGIPGMTEPQLMGFNISADGHYICGAIEQAAGFFTADCLTGEVKWMLAEEAGGELRSVDNNGMAIGYMDDGGVLYSFDTGEASVIKPPVGVRYVLGESLSNNGSVMAGSFTDQSFNTVAAYSADNEGWKELPLPTDEELGNLKDFLNPMSAAKLVSGDGNIIVGYLGSFSMPLVWKKNDAGEYIPDFFPERFVKAVEADRNDATKVLYGLTALYTCMSNNGKYVATIGLIANESNTDTRIVPIIYNTEDNTLKVYAEMQKIDELDLGLYPRAIADDGTFIGTISSPADPAGNFGSFIMRAGQEQAESYLEAFPAYAEKLGEAETLGLNTPTGISADGKNILGYTYYSENYDLSSSDPAYFITYVLTLDDTGVEQVDSAVKNGRQSIYSIDGRQLSRMQKGLNIVRNPDGTVTKILK